jgi:hypothetical protein
MLPVEERMNDDGLLAAVREALENLSGGEDVNKLVVHTVFGTEEEIHNKLQKAIHKSFPKQQNEQLGTGQQQSKFGCKGNLEEQLKSLKKAPEHIEGKRILEKEDKSFRPEGDTSEAKEHADKRREEHIGKVYSLIKYRFSMNSAIYPPFSRADMCLIFQDINSGLYMVHLGPKLHVCDLKPDNVNLSPQDAEVTSVRQIDVAGATELGQV